MNERLAKLARRRTDGAWELLATAAGNPVAIENCCEMLTAAMLDDLSQPGRMVEGRVEALSAFNPTALASLARKWPKPVRSQSLYVHMAWRVGLRHLLPIMPLHRAEFGVPILLEEASVVWRPESVTPITWRQAFDLIDERPIFNYTLVRELARHPFIGPYPTQIELEGSPTGMLRLLRGHVHQLDTDTRDYLAQCGRLCLGSDFRSGAYVAKSSTLDKSTGNWIHSETIKYIPLGNLNLAGNASAAPPIVELCREIGGNLVEELGDLLADQLPRQDPELAVRLIYLLLTHWCLP